MENNSYTNYEKEDKIIKDPNYDLLRFQIR